MLNQVKNKVTKRTRAIMPVHIYGHPVDMDSILDLAERHSLAVIEDAAEVHGAEYLSARGTSHPVWRRCGSFGTLSCFSFYANKLITTGEGGMVSPMTQYWLRRLDLRETSAFRPIGAFIMRNSGLTFA